MFSSMDKYLGLYTCNPSGLKYSADRSSKYSMARFNRASYVESPKLSKMTSPSISPSGSPSKSFGPRFSVSFKASLYNSSRCDPSSTSSRGIGRPGGFGITKLQNKRENILYVELGS